MGYPPDPLDIRSGPKPADFPRGFAETVSTGSFTRVLFDLGPGEIFDAGMDYYGEFFAGLEYAWDLLHREVVSFCGCPGRVSVVARFENAIQLKWRAA